MKLVAVAVLGSCALMAPAQLSYTFDADNQGWQQGNLDTASMTLSNLGPAQWNSGGFIDGPDFAAFAFHVSPILTGSHEWAYGHEISFDYRTDFSDNTVYPFLVLGNGTEAIFQQALITTSPTFGHYSYNLSAAGGWAYFHAGAVSAATETDIRHVLSTMTQFGVNADEHSGQDYSALDNVSVVPEPASVLALASGLVALIRRRKR